MSDFAIAHHEAAHAVAAHSVGFPIRMLSIHEREDSAGRTLLGNGDTGDPFSCAVIMVAGELAEKRALGRLERFNWFGDVGEDDLYTDSENARRFVEHYCNAEGGDVLDIRHRVEHQAYRLVALRWAAIEEIAAKLERDMVVLGEEVSRICLADKARRRAARAPRARPGSRVIPRGRRMSREEVLAMIAAANPLGAERLRQAWNRGIERR